MESIPIAKLVIEEPVVQPLSPTKQSTCKTCKQLFNRKEEDKMTSHYFRCKTCIDKQITRGFIASCILQ